MRSFLHFLPYAFMAQTSVMTSARADEADTAASANSALSSLVLGLSGGEWDRWLIVSVAFAALAAVAVGLTTAGSIISHKREAEAAEADLARYKVGVDGRVSEASRDVANANARAAAASKEAAEARLEQGRIEASNIELQTALKPRKFSFTGWAMDLKRVSAMQDALKAKAGTHALIQSVPDFEARLYANDIAGVLHSAGWIVEIVDSTRSHINDMSFGEGVYLFGISDGKTDSDAATVLWQTFWEADILNNGTDQARSNLPVVQYLKEPLPGYPSFDPPITGVFIRVGIKPLATSFTELQRLRIERDEIARQAMLTQTFDLPDGRTVALIPGHGPIEITKDAKGRLTAVDPAQQGLLPKVRTPTLVMPGALLRSSPPHNPP